MPSFNDAVEEVLKHEGGYVDDPLDRGGATNYGITQKVYKAFVKRPVTKAEMKSMPIGNAKAIYKKEYWDAIGGDKIKFYSVAATLFDQAVNRGVPTVSMQVQKVLGLPQDGKLGPKSIEALNKLSDKDFLSQFFLMSKKSYETIIERNPSQEKFRKGWMSRLSSLETYATKYLGTVNKTTVGLGLVALLGLSFFLYLKFKKK